MSKPEPGNKVINKIKYKHTSAECHLACFCKQLLYRCSGAHSEQPFYIGLVIHSVSCSPVVLMCLRQVCLWHLGGFAQIPATSPVGAFSAQAARAAQHQSPVIAQGSRLPDRWTDSCQQAGGLGSLMFFQTLKASGSHFRALSGVNKLQSCCFSVED